MTVAPEALREVCCENHARLQRLTLISSHMGMIEKGTFSIHQRAYLLRVQEEQKWIAVFTQLQDQLHAALNIYEAVQYADRSWVPRGNAAKRLWSIITKKDKKKQQNSGANAANFIPPPTGGHHGDWTAPDAEEIKARLQVGVSQSSFEAGGVQAYVGLAGDTGAVGGQAALERMGLNKTWAWAHNRNMPADLFSTRGSKVIQQMYGNHINRLTEIITQATDPRNPKTIAEVQREIQDEWPGLQRYQVERIARTETAAAWTTVSANAYAANGIGEYESTIAAGPTIGVESETPCDECVEMITMTQDMSGDLPPWHPNCRCEIVPILEDPETGDVWLPPDEPWAGGEAVVEGTAEADAATASYLSATEGRALPTMVMPSIPSDMEISGNAATRESTTVGDRLKPGDDIRWAPPEQLDASIYSASNRMSGLKNQIKRELERANPDRAKLGTLRSRLAREDAFRTQMRAMRASGEAPRIAAPPPEDRPPAALEGEESKRAWERQAGQWIGKLTDHETTAINRYTGEISSSINEGLRGGEIHIGLEDSTAAISSALSRASAPDTVVWRGLHEAENVLGRKLDDLVGRTFEDRGFMSASATEEGRAAAVGIRSDSALLRIHIPEGYQAGYIQMLAEQKAEQEILIQAGAQFRVTKVEYQAFQEGGRTLDHVPVIDVELLAREPEITKYTAETAAKETTGNLWRAMSRNGKAENAAQADIGIDQERILANELWKRWEENPDAGLPEGTIRFSDLRGERHMHSTYSDGHLSVKEMAETARSHGEQEVVISDHSHLLTPESIREQHKEIDLLNAAYKAEGSTFRILKGVEVNILQDGTLDLTDEQLAKFDWVQAGMHAGRDDATSVVTRRYLKVLEDNHPNLKTIAHPHTGGNNVDWEALAKAAKERGTILEVNARDILRRDTAEGARNMIRAAKQYGVKLQIGADAHNEVNLVDSLYGARFAAKEGVVFDDLAPELRVIDDVSVPGETPIGEDYLRIIKKLRLDTEDELPAGKRVKRILGSAKDSRDLHTDAAGKYDDVSQDAHLKLREKAAKEGATQEKPIALVTAGGPAAGKSVALRANPEMIPEKAVNVNPDDVMEGLTDYKAMFGDPGMAAALHEEASDVASDIMRDAIQARSNMVLDGVGDAEPGKFLGKIQQLKEAGYEVRVIMSDTPTNVAIERSVQRAIKEGSPDLNRFVPTRTLKGLYRDAVSRISEWQDSKFIDEWKLMRSSGEWGDTNTTLVAQGGKGSHEIVDPEQWKIVQAKKKLETGTALPPPPIEMPPQIPVAKLIANYQEGEFQNLNTALRKGGTYLEDELNTRMYSGYTSRNGMENLDKLISEQEPLTRDQEMYRGTMGVSLKDMLGHEPKIGETFHDPGFTAVSYDQDISADFAGFKGSSFFNIKVPKGTVGLDVDKMATEESMYSGQQEFVLPRNTEFKVTADRGTEFGWHEYDLEIVPKEAPKEVVQEVPGGDLLRAKITTQSNKISGLNTRLKRELGKFDQDEAKVTEIRRRIDEEAALRDDLKRQLRTAPTAEPVPKKPVELKLPSNEKLQEDHPVGDRQKAIVDFFEKNNIPDDKIIEAGPRKFMMGEGQYEVKTGEAVWRHNGVTVQVEKHASTDALTDPGILQDQEKINALIDSWPESSPLSEKLNEIVIARGVSPDEAYWSGHYKIADFKIAGQGDHTRGIVYQWRGRLPTLQQGIFAHEAGHIVGVVGGPPVGAWGAAIEKDKVVSGQFSRMRDYQYHAVHLGEDGVTAYATETLSETRSEDWAESVMLYMADLRNEVLGSAAPPGSDFIRPVRFRDLFPNRARILDKHLRGIDTPEPPAPRLGTPVAGGGEIAGNVTEAEATRARIKQIGNQLSGLKTRLKTADYADQGAIEDRIADLMQERLDLKSGIRTAAPTAKAAPVQSEYFKALAALQRRARLSI